MYLQLQSVISSWWIENFIYDLFLSLVQFLTSSLFRLVWIIATPALFGFHLKLEMCRCTAGVASCRWAQWYRPVRGHRAGSRPISNYRGPGCWCAFLWLHSLTVGMCTAVEPGDRSQAVSCRCTAGKASPKYAHSGGSQLQGSRLASWHLWLAASADPRLQWGYGGGSKIGLR